MDWSSAHVLVTGGASFIGSHLIDHLVEKGARRIRVVDDLSSGRVENIRTHIDSGVVEFRQSDLLSPSATDDAVQETDAIFHLAAIHGGRGYVELHQAGCAQNLVLDGALIRAAHRAGVQKFLFASSACVYPNSLQSDLSQELYLSEDMAGPPFHADGMYGWAKLMTELTLKSYYEDYGFRSASCRFFTTYGERAVENISIMAMIARAFIRQDPFEVWGDGSQIRNWTYVEDIVRGMVLAAEQIDDATVVNLGTEERIRVIDAVKEILNRMDHDPEIRFRPDMPVGPLNRTADPTLARKLLGWEYEVSFSDGLTRTIDWYVANKDPAEVERHLDRMLTER